MMRRNSSVHCSSLNSRKCDTHLDQITTDRVVYLDLGINAADADVRPSTTGIHRPRTAAAGSLILAACQPSPTRGGVHDTHIIVSDDVDNMTWVGIICVFCKTADNHLNEWC